MNRRTLLLAAAPVITLSGCITSSTGDDANGIDSGDSDASTESGDLDTHMEFESLADMVDCEGWETDRCPAESMTREINTEDGKIEFETAESFPYPEPPTEFRKLLIAEYVREFEAAYQSEAFLCGARRHRTTHYSYGGTVRHFDWYDDIYIVRIDGNAGDEQIYSDGSVSVGHWPSAAVYAIDETAALRTEAKEVESSEEETPDPVKVGEIVDCFVGD